MKEKELLKTITENILKMKKEIYIAIGLVILFVAGLLLGRYSQSKNTKQQPCNPQQFEILVGEGVYSGQEDYVYKCDKHLMNCEAIIE